MSGLDPTVPGQPPAVVRAAADLLERMLDAVDDALILMDKDGTVLFENVAARGLDAAPLSRAVLERIASETIASRAPVERGVSGEARHLVVRGRPVGGYLALLVIRDVSPERAREVQLLESEKLASMGLLSTGVAHEINNPASYVMANLRALSDLVDAFEGQALGALASNQEAKRAIGAFVSEVRNIAADSSVGMQRIQAISYDLRAFARTQDDPTAEVSVNLAVESALKMLGNELLHRTQVEVDLQSRRHVRCSIGRLTQVFLNLVMNALQALEDGRVAENRIRVRSWDEGSSVLVEVMDNGPGISPEVMSRMFEAFFTTKPHGLGTGMGLPISRDIVASMGGEISVQSEPGAGALFTVRLPGVTPQVTERSTTHRPPSRPQPRGRMLVVDDEDLLLKAYRRMLRSLCAVETASGAEQALALLERDRDFDIILCDLLMPVMSGMDLFRAVESRWPHLCDRFVFATGGAFTPSAQEFLRSSPPVSWVEKPIDLERLVTLVEERLPKPPERA